MITYQYLSGTQGMITIIKISQKFSSTVSTRAVQMGDTKISDYLERRYSLQSARVPAADADDSLLWLLLSPLDGAGAVPLEFGLARITSLCPPVDDL